MIKNETRKKRVVSKTQLCKTTLSKAIGLMFSRKLKDKGLVFVFDSDVMVDFHMFFVFYPIDVLLLDSNRKVVEIKEKFLPFTFYLPVKRFRYAIELPAGAVNASRTKVGDSVSFK